MAALTTAHWQEATSRQRYLASTIEQGIPFGTSRGTISGDCDAGYSGDLEAC